MTDNTIQRISVETKYGTEIVLIRQDKEPTITELKEMSDLFIHNYDLSYAHVESEGSIKLKHIPTSIKDYIKNEKQGL